MASVREKIRKQKMRPDEKEHVDGVMEGFLRAPSAQPDSAESLKILEANKDKNFVKRLLAPSSWPSIQADSPQGREHGLKKGEYASHQMGWGEGPGGKKIVYPNIVHTPTGGMQWLKPREAQKYAIKNKEFISFDKPQDADWFSQRYKAGVNSSPPTWRDEKKAWKK
jgi:hypothetical protein